MIVSRRRVEWHDTDAAGHQHHSAVLRWVEAAEAELLRSVGCARLFGRTPRVRHEVDYRSRVFFGDEVETTLRVVDLGRTSLTYAFDVACDDRPVASGRLVIVHAPSATGGAEPWPDDVRAALDPSQYSNSCSTAKEFVGTVDHGEGVEARRAE